MLETSKEVENGFYVHLRMQFLKINEKAVAIGYSIFLISSTDFLVRKEIVYCKFVFLELYDYSASKPGSSRGSLVVMVTDSLPLCHEFEPSTAEDAPCRGGRCMLNLSMLKRTPIGVEVRRKWCQFRCRPRHLTMGTQKKATWPHAGRRLNITVLWASVQLKLSRHALHISHIINFLDYFTLLFHTKNSGSPFSKHLIYIKPIFPPVFVLSIRGFAFPVTAKIFHKNALLMFQIHSILFALPTNKEFTHNPRFDPRKVAKFGIIFDGKNRSLIIGNSGVATIL
ncbi:UNVERIFIED_CONTAM: hypothetical protein NCL1_33124 [Trichonephila clavipes]